MTSSEWTPTTLTTLFHGLALSPADVSTLLPQTPTQITILLRELSIKLNNPSAWTNQRHTRAVLKHLTGLSPPPKPRKKALPKAPKHRISLQLVPATPADDAFVRGVGGYPFVEVVLKAGRRVWDVVRHLYQKWGLPVRVEVDRKVVSVDSLVCELLESGRSVRLPYRVVCVDIDWRLLERLLGGCAGVAGKKRVVAPRDDLLWSDLETKSLHDNAVYNLDENVCTFDQGNGNGNGEQAVLSRLRGHLEKLEESGDETKQKEVVEDKDDPAVIPEQFLRSCSRFEFAHSLPDSLLSLGKSDGSDKECNALQVMNDALDLRDEVEIDLRCDERLDADFLQPPPDSLGLSALFRES